MRLFLQGEFASALGIVTPWGEDSHRSCVAFLGSEAPFYEVGWEWSEPGNP